MKTAREAVKKKNEIQDEIIFVKHIIVFLLRDRMIALADCTDSFRHVRCPEFEVQPYSVSPKNLIFFTFGNCGLCHTY